jgi:calmodulin
MMRWLAAKLKQKRIRVSELFKSIDTGGDGSISGQELRPALENLGIKCTDQEFAQIMAKIDKDGGGDVSLKELDRALKAAEKAGPPPKRKEEHGQTAKKKQPGLTVDDKDEIRQIFNLFKQLCRSRAADDSGNVDLVSWDDEGTISTDELEQLLETVGLRLDPAEVQEMIKEIDADGSGTIDFSEFCDSMTKKIQVDHSPEEITKAFKAFAKGAPDGMIRVRDLRNALQTYMHKELVEAEIEELLFHYRDTFVKIPGHEHEYFNYQDYIDLMAPMAKEGDE